MTPRESKRADFQSAFAVAASASSTVMGANLSVSNPLRFERGVAPARDSVFGTAADGRLADGDRSRSANDEGADSRGNPTSAGAAGLDDPKRNRRSRISIAANFQTHPEKHETGTAGEATSNFDLRTRGVYKGQHLTAAGRKPCACPGRPAAVKCWPNVQRLWGRIGRNTQPRRNAAAGWS